MLVLGPLGFSAPWFLAGLALLPALWLILRALPPAPRRLRFAGTRLLMGLRDGPAEARRTPWWLMLLRVAALAALILSLAGPVWRPAPAPDADPRPLLVVMDAGWAAAPDWEARKGRARAALTEAARAGRPVALLPADGADTPDGAALAFGPDSDALARLAPLGPRPWATRYPADPGRLLAAAPEGGLATLWVADGLDHPGRDRLLAALAARGPVRVVLPDTPRLSLARVPGAGPGGPAAGSPDAGAPSPLPAGRTAAGVGEDAMAAPPAAGAAGLWLWATDPAARPTVLAIGADPQGRERVLARLRPADPGATTAPPAGWPAPAAGITLRPVPLDLPTELRNRITRFRLEGVESAGAVVLADDSLRRRKVGLIGEDRASEGQSLLSPLHYLRQALAPSADLVEGVPSDLIAAAPDVIVLADRTALPETPALRAWVEQGGLLLRFAGPRMAAAEGLADEPLLPVRLRAGGRDIGGALSWGTPRAIAPFDPDGPFGGLAVPPDATVRAQLLAEPTPELGERTLARLADGTPLVTRMALGKGQVVLFHTSADAEWSSLPLSGLFVAMLERLVATAGLHGDEASGTGPVGTASEGRAAHVPGADEPGARQAVGSAQGRPAPLVPVLLLDGRGRPAPPDDPAPVAAADFALGAGPLAPPGLYRAAQRLVALNAGGPIDPADWPGAVVVGNRPPPGVALDGWLIAAAAALLALDAAGSALLSRGRRPFGRGAA